MNSPFIHFTNPFMSATESSYLKALNISTFHNSALAGMQTDPFFGPLYTAYHPLHLAFKNAFSNWVTQADSQTGRTLNLTQLLAQLASAKIKQWDVAIQMVHTQNTPAYQSLLAGKRAPFQHGGQSEKISAVHSLGLALTGDVPLASVKTDVDAFYLLIDNANTVQKTSKTSTSVHSASVETARVAMCNAQYANMGAMIQRFASAPETLATYFDLHALRNGNHVNFTGHIKPLHKHTVCKHTFSAADNIEVNNTGAAVLNIYMAATKDGASTSPVIAVAPNANQTIPASTLGNLSNLFLMVANPDENVAGEWEVTLL